MKISADMIVYGGLGAWMSESRVRAGQEKVREASLRRGPADGRLSKAKINAIQRERTDIS